MRRRVRALLWVGGFAIGLVVAVVAVGYRYFDPGWRYDVHGVDVSHHQGSVDWSQLAADIDFAFIKATEGGDWTDSRFAENWMRAEEAGIIRGAYHFFTLCRDGAEQAAHLIATVPDTPGALPPAIDLEFGGNCSARPSPDAFRAELDTFLEMVEAHYQATPIVYTTPRFFGHYLSDEPPDVIWWMRSPIWQPWGSPEWSFWQYFPGRLQGVEGRVDRNVFRGDLADLIGLGR